MALVSSTTAGGYGQEASGLPYNTSLLNWGSSGHARSALSPRRPPPRASFLSLSTPYRVSIQTLMYGTSHLLKSVQRVT